MTPLALGIVSDEITTDFPEAVRHGTSWGVRKYEIRCLTSGRVPAIDANEWKSVLDIVRSSNVEITALSPGIFKLPLSNIDGLERELKEVLPRTIDMAKECGATLIIAFGFLRERGEPAERYRRAMEIMRRAAEMAQKESLRIAIENEPGFWCDTGAHTARLIRDVDSPALGANWDPANAYGTDETPFPDGYRALKGLVYNVHAKDTLKGSLVQCVPIGDGVIDWQGQMSELLKDRPVGHVTIETHCHPLVDNSRRNVETLQALMGVPVR